MEDPSLEELLVTPFRRILRELATLSWIEK